MWRKLWRWLKQCYQSIQQRFQKPEPPPPPPRRQIPDIEFETKFMPLLEAVANGASGGEIQAQRMTTGIKAEEWIPWLQRFGEQLQQNPETHAEIAQRLVQFGQLHRGELGTVAERIGRQILAQIPPPVVEVEQTGNVQHKHEVQKWYQQGIDQYNRGNFVDAIASWNEAIHLQPNFHKAYYRRGITQANLGQYEDAIASYNQAIRFKDDFSDAYHRRGIVLCDVLGQYEDAIASFNAAIRFKSDFPLTYYNLGVAQVNLGRYEDAIASFDSALTLKPDDWLVWGTRGIVAGRVETRNSP